MPNLLHDAESLLLKTSSPCRRGVSRHHHKHHHTSRARKVSSTAEHRSHAMRFQRFALSVDEAHPLQPESSHGSQCSVTFDPKPEIIDIVPIHKKREQRTKRSDTAKKHVLSRQKPIEPEQQHKVNDEQHRPGSALSDNSMSPSRYEKLRMGGSVDSRSPDRVLRYCSPKKIQSTPSIDKDFR